MRDDKTQTDLNTSRQAGRHLPDLVEIAKPQLFNGLGLPGGHGGLKGDVPCLQTPQGHRHNHCCPLKLVPCTNRNDVGTSLSAVTLKAFGGQQVAELWPASLFLVIPRQHHHSLYPVLPCALAVSNPRHKHNMWLEHSDNFLDESLMFLAFLLVKLPISPTPGT